MGWLRARKERHLLAFEEHRQARRLVDEDVTVFGEQLGDLHVETLTTELDDAMRADYQKSLELYERAKAELARAEDAESLGTVTTSLVDGRFHLACVLARRDGVDLPHRRESCFFNPQHGPAATDVAWTPPGGVEREVPVCRNDANRLDAGEAPAVRLVRVGDRYVPWYEARAGQGLLTDLVGVQAAKAVPPYAMLEAELNRTRINVSSAGFFDGGFGSGSS